MDGQPVNKMQLELESKTYRLLLRAELDPLKAATTSTLVCVCVCLCVSVCQDPMFCTSQSIAAQSVLLECHHGVSPLSRFPCCQRGSLVWAF